MKIIISPAKKMKSEPDLYPCRELPVFLAEARQLAGWIQKLTYQEAKELWKCSDAIAKENFRRFQDMDLERIWLSNAFCISFQRIQEAGLQNSAFLLSH